MSIHLFPKSARLTPAGTDAAETAALMKAGAVASDSEARKAREAAMLERYRLNRPANEERLTATQRLKASFARWFSGLGAR